MKYEILGHPDDSPTLELDHEEFAYAGKFGVSSTGKAVARDDSVVAAVSFDDDRVDDCVARIRYVSVRSDRRGEEIGPTLCDYVCDALLGRGYERVRIAVNNPFAYRAMYKAGFEYTGETVARGELVLERPAESPRDYEDGLDEFGDVRDETVLEKPRPARLERF